MPAKGASSTGEGEGRSGKARTAGADAKTTARLRSVAATSGRVKREAKAPAPPKKETGKALPPKDLSLHYHILKLLVGSIFRAPEDKINLDEVLESTQEWLIITPFSRPKLRKGLEALAQRNLLRVAQENGRKYYRITEAGRTAYAQYREVMTLWRVEKIMGERMKLYTVSEVIPKRTARDKDYIPDECFIDWPLKFEPIVHKFDGSRELRVYDAFEKMKK